MSQAISCKRKLPWSISGIEHFFPCSSPASAWRLLVPLQLSRLCCQLMKVIILDYANNRKRSLLSSNPYTNPVLDSFMMAVQSYNNVVVSPRSVGPGDAVGTVGCCAAGMLRPGAAVSGNGVIISPLPPPLGPVEGYLGRTLVKSFHPSIAKYFSVQKRQLIACIPTAPHPRPTVTYVAATAHASQMQILQKDAALMKGMKPSQSS